MSDEGIEVGVDTTVPHSARVWNYWLGGKDNFAVDRAAGDAYARTFPSILSIARATRAFIGRSVTWLATDMGVRQFLDVGTGLPTADNTHEVAQRAARDARIVYVDNDPLVLTHARALLTSTPEGGTAYVDADMRDPERILAEAAKVLDLDEPVAVLFIGVLGHVGDLDEARSIARRIMTPLPSGSYLVLSDGTKIHNPEQGEAVEAEYESSGAIPYRLRTPEEIASLFEGLELVDPGVVSVPRWRPTLTEVGGGLPAEIDEYGGVARKP
jgi:SAM-dependent methyltransferase